MITIQVVGKTKEVAEDLCKKAGLRMRVVNENGTPRIVTADYRTDRVNVTVVDGKVTKADIG